MAQVSAYIDDVTLDGESEYDEVVVRFTNKNGKPSKKVLVIDNTGTIHVYEDEAEQETKTVRLFKKPIKTWKE